MTTIPLVLLGPLGGAAISCLCLFRLLWDCRVPALQPPGHTRAPQRPALPTHGPATSHHRCRTVRSICWRHAAHAPLVGLRSGCCRRCSHAPRAARGCNSVLGHRQRLSQCGGQCVCLRCPCPRHGGRACCRGPRCSARDRRGCGAQRTSGHVRQHSSARPPRRPIGGPESRCCSRSELSAMPPSRSHTPAQCGAIPPSGQAPGKSDSPGGTGCHRKYRTRRWVGIWIARVLS